MKISKAVMGDGKEFARGFLMIALGWFVATIITTNLQAASPLVIDTTNGGRLVIDLHNPIDRKVFREQFAEDPKVSGCFRRADWGVKLMTERDAGTTKEQHLQQVEVMYEKTKLEPEGAIPWHVFIDFGRTVRDIHRSAGSSTKGQYRYADANEVWVREFKWCAIDR